jgi:pyruvate-formate lyase-activating enzyme
VFCTNPAEGWREGAARFSYARLARRLKAYKAGAGPLLKFDAARGYFNLTGGEPTLHPEFHKVLALVRTEFPAALIRLLTNGRAFAYADFARRALGIARAPFELALPLMGHDARTHDALSRAPGSFEQTLRGLGNIRRLRGPGQRVELRVVLTRPVVRRLDRLLDWAARELGWADRLVVLFAEFEGSAQVYRDRLLVPVSECGAALGRCADALARFAEVRLYHFPLCSLPTRLWPLAWNTLADFKVLYLERCRTRCAHRDHCVGVHRSYERACGARDIRPLSARRPVSLRGDRYHPVAGLLEGG